MIGWEEEKLDHSQSINKTLCPTQITLDDWNQNSPRPRLFLLSFGKDDYVALFYRGSESDRLAPKYGRRGFARLLVSRLIQAIKVTNPSPARSFMGCI